MELRIQAFERRWAFCVSCGIWCQPQLDAAVLEEEFPLCHFYNCTYTNIPLFGETPRRFTLWEICC